MSPHAAQILLGLAELYAIFGGAVAIAFAVFGIGRIDRAARGACGFRVLLLPGLIALWPCVLWRWARAARVASQHP